MTAVSSEISSASKLNPSKLSPFSPLGSRAQLTLFSVPHGTRRNGNLAYTKYAMRLTMNGSLVPSLVGAGMAYLYRGFRQPVENASIWNVYSFNNNGSLVPSLVGAGMAYLYRGFRQPVENANIWSVYFFHNYNLVP